MEDITGVNNKRATNIMDELKPPEEEGEDDNENDYRKK